jgi:peptide-methionine (S)-S-oxide reductase
MPAICGRRVGGVELKLFLLSAVMASASAFAPMRMVIANGQVAKVNFRLLELPDRVPFEDTTFDQGTVRLEVGGGGYLPELHAAIRAMSGDTIGEKTTVSGLKPFGEYSYELAAELPWEQSPDPKLKEGTSLRLWNGQRARVTKVDSGTSFTIDANPPNAGKLLELEVELLDLPEDGASVQEEIVLAMGCFWGAELAFARLPGVISTAVGYTQGAKESPTYSEVCSGSTGHTEAVRVRYDPKEVTLAEILRTFWERHDPTQKDRQGNDVGSQYRGGIYYRTDEQKHAAEASMTSEAERLKHKLATELLPATTFWMAEDYHQQYLEKTSFQSAKKRAKETIRCYG